jgi:hypothetical protein
MRNFQGHEFLVQAVIVAIGNLRMVGDIIQIIMALNLRAEFKDAVLDRLVTHIWMLP